MFLMYDQQSHVMQPICRNKWQKNNISKLYHS